MYRFFPRILLLLGFCSAGSTPLYGVVVEGLLDLRVLPDQPEPGNTTYEYELFETADRTDYTCGLFSWDGTRRSNARSCLDAGSTWYVVDPGAAFDYQSIAAGSFPVWDQQVAIDVDPFYIGITTPAQEIQVAIISGGAFPHEAGFGWVKFAKQGASELTIVESAFAFGVHGIEVGGYREQYFGVRGDQNDDGQLTVEDADLLTQTIAGLKAASGYDARYDFNGDVLIDHQDLFHWAEVHSNSWVGDTNFDGEWTTYDLVLAFQAGTYEREVQAVWSTGDWNGDGRFNSSDLVALFTQTAGDIRGPRPSIANTVPEPTGQGHLVFALFAAIAIGAKRQTPA